MAAVHSSVSAEDRELMRRLAVLLVFIVVFTAAFSDLHRLYSKKFYDLTGGADWIWAPHRISRNVPVVFFAARDFDLPAHRLYAHIKVLGDPEYTLYFNGREIGGRRVHDDRHLDVYDVSPLARDGRNRILVAVRSVSGVGGLIATVDISPEEENLVVTDRHWKIFTQWHDDLPSRDSGSPAPPMVIGEPPAGRWNYLTPRPAAFTKPPERVVKPKAVSSFRTELAVIRIRGGVAITVSEPVRATAYDFGPVTGRVRLELVAPPAVPRVVNVRLANAAEELNQREAHLRPFVFGAGEHAVVDPEVHSFRYVVVYGEKGVRSSIFDFSPAGREIENRRSDPL